MIAMLGELALCVAALAGVWSMLECAGALRAFSMARLRGALTLQALVTTLALVILGVLLMSGDMRVAYVARHTERALAPHLRLAALWAGQEGSLLLWASLAAIGAAVAAHTKGGAARASLGVLAGLNLFFAVLVLMAADPFGVGTRVPEDGAGLHPQLQHWAMVVHPPLVFGAYALMGVVFALVAGGALAGRTAWNAARVWATGAWTLLSAGIALGGYWAYAELGWGGYWAWDPVENASLMPWLTCTALLHALGSRGSRSWALPLACGTFLLCVLGTLLTRSGVVQSVHAFAGSSVGAYFCVLLIAVAWVSAMAAWLSRECIVAGMPRPGGGIVVCGMALLVGMMLLTLVGTMAPVVASLVTGGARGVSSEFYTRTVAPLGLLLAALMTMAPFLGTGGARDLSRRVAPFALLGLMVSAGAFLGGLRHPAVVAAAGVAACGVCGLAAALVARVRGHATLGAVRALAHVVDADHRRAGGYIAHAGFFVLVVSLGASSVLGARVEASLLEGESVAVGRWTLSLERVEPTRGAGWSGATARLWVTGDGQALMLEASRTTYERAGASVARATPVRGWWSELHVTLAGVTESPARAAVQVRTTPMIAWVWAGAGLTCAGGCVCVTPRIVARGVWRRMAGVGAVWGRTPVGGTP